MEIKLKEYKYLIQVLRKEKIEIEQTYEHKLSNMKDHFQDHAEIELKKEVVPKVVEKIFDVEKENLKN